MAFFLFLVGFCPCEKWKFVTSKIFYLAVWQKWRAGHFSFLVPGVRTKQLELVSLGTLWIFIGHSGDLKVLAVFSSWNDLTKSCREGRCFILFCISFALNIVCCSIFVVLVLLRVEELQVLKTECFTKKINKSTCGGVFGVILNWCILLLLQLSF